MGYGLAAKLFWIWISLIVTVITFWRVRHMWLKRHPERDKGLKYSQRLAKRLRDRRVLQLQSRQGKNIDRRRRH
ncbi:MULTISPECIES: hypothetical protein [Pseudomonadota]|jgi:hypothetical protein|uniref:hypothetical protein n=1 Tax=Pseudomonadota TaxID=1224 RepID=UPI00076ABA61|nr:MULTISPECIES: hypothetical protein [Pseudomonadota]MDT0138247.1 hypothetical protein [Acidovorax sp. PRC11]NEJ91579.1 hypothetical protein [Rhizobium ruizarguesonis]